MRWDPILEREREIIGALVLKQACAPPTAHPLMVVGERYQPLRKITHPGEKIV
jgi:hypothetical protein